MVRTAATAVRVSGGKSTKAIRNSAPSGASLQSARNSGSIGGNAAVHRDTPPWQKPITNFFRKTDAAESPTTTTSVLMSNETPIVIDDKENVPSTSNTSTIQKEENSEITTCTQNEDMDNMINKSEKECSPRSEKSNHSNNKENEDQNSNGIDSPTKKNSRDEDDADLLPAKRPKIDYKNLEAIEKFAS